MTVNRNRRQERNWDRYGEQELEQGTGNRMATQPDRNRNVGHLANTGTGTGRPLGLTGTGEQEQEQVTGERGRGREI